MRDHRDLVSVYGAVALAWAEGRRCTESTFRTYVSRGDAPEPATRIRRQPFWSRRELWQWLGDDVDRRRAAPLDPPTLVLTDPGLLETEGRELGDAALAELALKQLPEIIVRLEQIVGVNRERYDRVAEHLGTAEVASLSPMAIIEWAAASRRVRANEHALERFLARIDEASPHLKAARQDLERTRQWVGEVRAWSTAVSTELATERDARLADTWLRGLDDDLPVDQVLPTLDYALAQPSRVSYVIDAKDEPWGLMTDAQRRAVDPGAIVLKGADFGYRWSLPAAPGDWRLSWHGTDLYFESRSPTRPGLVVPLASVHPPAGLLQDEIAWLAPFEEIQAAPGAAGLLLREIKLEESLGWPGVRSEDDW